jgi:hypothetical protein
VVQPSLAIPDVTGLGWSNVRAIARERAAADRVDDLLEAVMPLLNAPEIPRRLLAVYVLGYTSGRRPENLNALRDIRRAHSQLVDAETATWNLADPREAFTYQRVLARR